MKKLFTYALVTVALFSVIFSVYWWITSEERELRKALMIGESAPNFTLEDMNGVESSLSDFEGQTVVLNFWASWCEYCKEEMPELMKVEDEHEDLTVLAVNYSKSEWTIEHPKRYLEEESIDLTVLFDYENEAVIPYNVQYLPDTIIIDENQQIKARYRGQLTEDILLDLLDR